jgi:predicted nucleotidyltransferase
MTIHGIDLDSPAIRDFCQKWKINELSVFGSILSEDFRPESDIDFLAKFEDCHQVHEYDLFDEIHMLEELSKTVGRDVDLVDRSVIESTSNRFVREELLSTAEPVYAAQR